MSRGRTNPSMARPLRAPIAGSDGSFKYASTANTTARPARTRVEGSRRIARDYGISPHRERRGGAGQLRGGGEIRPLEIVENARPLDRLCKDDVGTRLTRARDEGLTVARHDHDARPGSRLRAKLADQHVTRDVGQAKIAEHDVEGR